MHAPDMTLEDGVAAGNYAGRWSSLLEALEMHGADLTLEYGVVVCRDAGRGIPY